MRFLFVIIDTCSLSKPTLGCQFENFYSRFTDWWLVATVGNMLSKEHSPRRDLHPHKHIVVKIPKNPPNHPSNPYTGLISAKRIAHHYCIHRQSFHSHPPVPSQPLPSQLQWWSSRTHSHHFRREELGCGVDEHWLSRGMLLSIAPLS